MQYGFKEARKKAGLSGEDAAEALGVSRQIISHWETGRKKPSFDHLLQLSSLYGTTLDNLVYGKTSS